MTTQYKDRLKHGIQALGLNIDDAIIERLIAYHGMLVKWNKAYNLTSVRDPQQMIDRHLIDSLSLLPLLNNGSVIDVGTGPGLPGMVIAIARPDIAVTLLDSNGKKTRFLSQVKMTLGVSNATVVNHRLESWQPEIKFEQITSRAFATLSDMVSFSRHLLSSDGRFLAMKGLYPGSELAELPSDIDIRSVKPLSVPGTEGERHLVELAFK